MAVLTGSLDCEARNGALEPRAVRSIRHLLHSNGSASTGIIERSSALMRVKASQARVVKNTEATPRRADVKARDVMTRDVIIVRPDTSVRDIATLMVEKHISGVPVVTDDGDLLGMVSQSDLLHRAELGTERKHKWWFRIFADSSALAGEYAKVHGLKAHDIMSRLVISVRDDAELRDVADILDRRRIKRIPVLREDRIVGIITRGDLVRALSQVQVSKTAKAIGNAALHKKLYDRIQAQPWISDNYISLSVSDGVVEVGGFVETADQRAGLLVLIEETEGVNRVDDKINVGLPVKTNA
jgi:CBS domain-containing protein